jgi:hypothetical protein
MNLSRRQFLRASGHGLAGLGLAALAEQFSPRTVLAQAPDEVDAQTLFGKVLCGYQGWFRCPGDGTGQGWRHWSRSTSRIGPDTLTVEMWPDLSEYSDAELYSAAPFTDPDGQPTSLFSSANPLTVNRHFNWMYKYGIDGVLVQRFVTGLTGPPNDILVLENVRAAANRTGRVFAVEYDMSGTPTDQLLGRLVSDWSFLVDQVGIIDDPSYLYHDGRPVLGIWGFFTNRFDGALANQIIDAFTADGPSCVFLIGGSEWYWRTDAQAPPGSDWANAFRRFDVISPWNVGNVTISQGQKFATTNYWRQDLAEATRVGMLYLPVLYPGFSWDNLMQLPPGTSLIPRLGGAFFWDQFVALTQLGVGMAKVAMFDEVDEGTAIFKVTNNPPPEAYFVTYDGLPSDWYLWLTGLGTQFTRGTW